MVQLQSDNKELRCKGKCWLVILVIFGILGKAKHRLEMRLEMRRPLGMMLLCTSLGASPHGQQMTQGV